MGKNYLRYLYALLAVPLAILLRFALMPLIGPGIPYITLFPVTVAVALFAGLGPSILTGILGSIVIDYLFILPLHAIEFNIEGISRIAVVTITSAFVGYVGAVLRAARTKAEQQALALRESQADLNRAQAVAYTGSWRMNVQKNELTWSDENHRIFGIPKETPMTYETFLSTVHPDDLEYVDKSWKAALQGEPYDIEHRIVVDGKIKWVRERANLEIDKNGILLGGFGTTQDITERRQMEDELRKSQDELEKRVQERTKELNTEIAERKKAEETVKAERQRLYNVLETLPVYVILLTEDYHVPFANRTFEERFGASNGRKCYEYLFGRNEPCETCETYTVMKTGKPHHWGWTGPDGRNYDIFDFPFTDTDGSRLIMEMGIDITEQKAAEAELEKYRLHLEEMVKQQTDELIRSNKDLEQFAYVASHDLQEPLRMIAGYTQLLQQRYKNKLDEDANQFIFYTVDGVLRMQSLITDLLTYSRLNTSSEALEPVDCRAVLDDVLATMQMTIEENGAVIKYGTLPTVQANNGLLFQLFQNLISNAIKFRSDKPPLINITARPQDKQWLFSVSDNGIGMEPQYLERIFVIFQRLHTRDKYPGTGIGLAICKKIVERHGGRIWVESQPGKGSTFHFII